MPLVDTRGSQMLVHRFLDEIHMASKSSLVELFARPCCKLQDTVVRHVFAAGLEHSKRIGYP